MKTLNTLKENYKRLELNLSQHFEALVSERQFSFMDSIMDEFDSSDEQDRVEEVASRGELNMLPTIERRNEFTGNVIDCYVLSVTEEVIGITDFDNDTEIKLIKFSDLADVSDRLNLLDEMETLLK